VEGGGRLLECPLKISKKQLFCVGFTPALKQNGKQETNDETWIGLPVFAGKLPKLPQILKAVAISSHSS